MINLVEYLIVGLVQEELIVILFICYIKVIERLKVRLFYLKLLIVDEIYGVFVVEVFCFIQGD